MKIRYILDTKFILRHLLRDNDSQYIKTKEVFDKAMSGEVTLVLEGIVFTEVIFVLSSVYKVPRSEITGFMTFLITYKGIECELEILKLALIYYRDKNIHIVDAILLARSNIEETEVLTFDKKIQKILEF